MTGIATLRMYDLAEVRTATEELWAAVARRLPGGVPTLTWHGRPGVEWSDPGLVVGQTCGWPLITRLRDTVTVVGAFDYDIEGASGLPAYRSVLIAAEPSPLASFAGTIAAVNSRDSLSGWVSLGAAVADLGGPAPFFGGFIETGSHRGSVEAVRSGAASIASIDAVSYALFERHLPELTRGLVVVGRGPDVPTLPLITAAPDAEALRTAFEAAIADPATADCRARLRVRGFHRMALSSYEHLACLGLAAGEALGAP